MPTIRDSTRLDKHIFFEYFFCLMRVVCVIFVLLLASMTSAQCQKTAYSGKVDFPELFKYNDQKNTNLETALQSISSSFNEQEVTVTQELLAAIMATLVKEVEVHAFLPKEEQWDYGMGTGCSRPNGCKNDGIGHYQGGVDYKGRGYIQLTLKSNYEKYCPDCVGTSAPELDVCGCKNQMYCTVTDAAICPQVKALQPERADDIFASYYIKSPQGKDLVSLSNEKSYLEVGKAINIYRDYAPDFNAIANDNLMLFRNNPDKTEKLLTWLNSGTSAMDSVSTPYGLKQLEQNGNEIDLAEENFDRTVAFKAKLKNHNGKKVKLQVELRRLDEYDGQFIDSEGHEDDFKNSEFVISGSEATAYAYGLIDGDYHWRARAVDEDGIASEWVDFGGNDISEADFSVTEKTAAVDALSIGTATSSSDIFGSATTNPTSLKGDIYYLPEDASSLPDFSSLTPVGSIYTNVLNIPKRSFTDGFPGITDRFEWFAIRYTGAFNIGLEGEYAFRLVSDDGSRLLIDGNKIIDNDGQHSTLSASGNVYLTRGQHSIEVDYFQGPRDDIALQLYWTPPGGSESIFDGREETSSMPINNYSGVATRSRDGETWPFKLTLIGPNSDGSISGQIEWTSLNSIHQIEGSKTATGITFTETAYIKKGDAVLNCKYYLNSEGNSLKGTWDSCGSGNYGDITVNPL